MLREIKTSEQKVDDLTCDVMVDCSDNEYPHRIKLILDNEILLILIPPYHNKKDVFLYREETKED